MVGALVLVATGVNVGLEEKWAGRFYNFLGLVLGVLGIALPLFFPAGH